MVDDSSETSSLSVLLVQNRPKGSLSENLRKVKKLLSGVRLSEVDLIVFPEYLFGAEKSETLSTKTLSFFEVLCRKNSVNVVSGSVPEEENGNWYNTSFLVNRMGELIGRYRKMHLGPLDREYTEGDVIGIFPLEGVKIGIGICRDLWFPEYWRILRERGASLFVVPSFIKMPEWYGFLAMAKTRAVENQVFLLLCNNGESGVGRSCVIRYDAGIVASLHKEPGTLLVELDLSKAGEWRDEIGYKRRTDIHDIIEKGIDDEAKSLL